MSDNRLKCAALEWDMTDEKQKDYVPCDSPDAVACRLEGLLIAVDANLCKAHQGYFAKRPKGWGTVKVYDLKSGRRIQCRPYGGAYLSAEKMSVTTKREPVEKKGVKFLTDKTANTQTSSPERALQRRNWPRVTPCQLEMLIACETSDKHCSSVRHLQSMWSLKAKGYINTHYGNWYSITQRGKDYLRFGTRKRKAAKP